MRVDTEPLGYTYIIYDDSSYLICSQIVFLPISYSSCLLFDLFNLLSTYIRCKNSCKLNHQPSEPAMPINHLKSCLLYILAWLTNWYVIVWVGRAVIGCPLPKKKEQKKIKNKNRFPRVSWVWWSCVPNIFFFWKVPKILNRFLTFCIINRKYSNFKTMDTINLIQLLAQPTCQPNH